MEISQFFINGDIKGAIAYMRDHEEFKDILPAYVAIFENCEYRTFDIPDKLNDILRLYQVYYRDTFYCGVPEAEAADRLLAQLRALLHLPDAEEALLAERCLKRRAIMRFSGKRRGITAPISGGKSSRRSIRSSCRMERRNIPSIFSRASYSAAGWII